MSRLFAYMGNDPARVACALHAGRRLLTVAPEPGSGGFDGWGIGFYQGGEVLLQRRPKPPTETVDFYPLACELRTDAIVGHVRRGTVGAPKNENTHPFRFRSWLFAHHGTIPAFDGVRERLLANVPDFLRRNIRGQTDSEHLFHLVLAFLHDAGKLDDPTIAPEALALAVRESMALVDKLVRECVGPASATATSPDGSLAITNGRVLVATRRGRPALLFQSSAIVDCPVCREATLQPGRPPKRVAHEHLRSVLFVADAPAPPAGGAWQELPDETLVSVSHDLKVELSPLRG